MRVDVMQGYLGEFDLAQVLQVVGLGRQYTGVQLSLAGGGTGTIFVKSGQVVSVSTPSQQGEEAFHDLFKTARGAFLVYRDDTPQNLEQPLGALNDLLVSAIARRESDPPPSIPDHPTNMGVAPPAPGSNAPVVAPMPTPPPFQSPVHSQVQIPSPFQAPAEASVRATAEASAQALLQPLGAPQEPTIRAPASADSEAPVSMPGFDEPASLRGVAPIGGAARLDNAAPLGKTDAKSAPLVLGVVSPKGGSGKSTVSLNLALSLARRGHSVILVDGDVNGDVLSAIDARDRVKKGALDVVAGKAAVDEALLDTVLPRFKLMPAVGSALPDPELLALDPLGGWPRLTSELALRADIVVVDTPSGMFGPTRPILGAVSHVLGVLQAEVLASRSFERFREGLESLPKEDRPVVAGVVLNMLQTRHDASMAVFQNALVHLPAAWLLDTTIPRHPAFLDATHQGVPLRQLDEDAPPPVAFLFDNLAGELAERVGLRRAAAARPHKLLL